MNGMTFGLHSRMTLALVIGALACGAGCAQAQDGSDEAASGADQNLNGAAVPAFADAAGAATNVMFEHSPGAPTAAMRGPSAALQTALDELNRQGKGNNETFTAATFTFSQNFVLDAFASLKKGHACDLDPLQAAFDAMFFSLEPKRDGEDAHNNLANDSMSCRPLAAQPATDKHPARSLVSTTLKGFRAGSAYAALVDPNNEPKISSDDLTKLVSASSTAGQSFLKDNAGAAIYACDWSNTDDESATALIAVNAGTKQLRVLFGYVGP